MPPPTVVNGARQMADQVDALTQRAASLDQREQRLDAREERLEKREEQLQQREALLLAREKRWFAREGGENAEGGSPSSTLKPTQAEKPHRAEVWIDDVPGLLSDYRLSGGVVPAALLVAEASAMKAAATQCQELVANKDAQIKELEERLKIDMPVYWVNITNEAVEQKVREREQAISSTRLLMDKFRELRSAGIERLVPKLLQTANHFQAVFEEAIAREVNGEATLASIGELCSTVPTKGRELRQHLPSSLPRSSMHTLLLLLARAMDAAPRVQRLASRAVAGWPGCKVLSPPQASKGIPRALEKVQEEYDGDYTRLLDYCRTSIVCDSLSAFQQILAWLCSPSAPGFRVCRIKDRISREGGYDPETSGGNRDVLLNGWLDMGVGPALIVEIQVHLEILFALKADLHLLYDGARVLGSFDPAVTAHEGMLSEGVLQKLERGVLRDARCVHSRATKSQLERVVKVCQSEPNGLQHMAFGYSELVSERGEAGALLFAGWTLERIFVPPTGAVACTRLKHLELPGVGLVGTIPAALSACRAMSWLSLNSNFLEGPLPEWFAELPNLKFLFIERNLFSGTVDVLGRCKDLHIAVLADNCFEGELSAGCLPALARMYKFRLGTVDEAAPDDPCFGEFARAHHNSLKTRAGYRNSRLKVTSQNKAELCKLWAEQSRFHAERFRETQYLSFAGERRPYELDQDGAGTWPAVAED